MSSEDSVLEGAGAGRLRIALSVLIAIEATVTAAGAVYLIDGLLTAQAVDRTAATWEAVLACGAALGLVALIRPVARGRRWARGPVLTTQLILLPVAFYMTGSEKWYIGAPLLVVAVVALGLVIRPEVL